ncbi:hypothetical protein KY320_02755 [Candidatus Woesearchaeota archaeon]|nr:hypothetical protein [Candidatus Woesearchaeota archaeon]
MRKRLMRKREEQRKAEQEKKTEKSSLVKHIYDRHYLKLMFVPLALAIVALILILSLHARTGDFFYKGVSLKGGTTITISASEEISSSELEQLLMAAFPSEEFSVRLLRDQGVVKEITIETSLVEHTVDDVIPVVADKLGREIDEKDYSIQTIGGSLSESFFQQIIRILALAFLLMAIVVFIYFKAIIPGVAVVLASMFDMIITLAIVNMLGLRISTAGIAAFLMLMDYSIDMNSMLIANILKREQGMSVWDGIRKAFSTGSAMTLAGIGAMGSAYFVTTSPIIKQIMIILVIGLLIDALTTWLQNASLVRWYVERKGQ